MTFGLEPNLHLTQYQIEWGFKMNYLKLRARKLTVLARMIFAVGLAVALLSLFQNCSKINFAGDSKILVQGVVTPTSSIAGISTNSASPKTPGSDQGICVLTCALAADNNDVHEFSQAASCKDPAKPAPVCEAEDDGLGMPLTSIVQTVSNADSHPKTVCVSKVACLMIGASLAAGKLILNKVTNNQVSTLKGTTFQTVESADDCQDTLTDEEVKNQFEPTS